MDAKYHEKMFEDGAEGDVDDIVTKFQEIEVSLPRPFLQPTLMADP